MKTTKKITLEHDDVCHALIDYIARDKDERITGVPTLFVSTDESGAIQQCVVEFEIKTSVKALEEQEIEEDISEYKFVNTPFVPVDSSCRYGIPFDKSDKKEQRPLQNYDSRDGAWVKKQY